MSTPTILTFAPKIDPEAPPWLRQHLTLIYQKLGNHTQAMALLANKTGAASTTTVVEGGSSGGGGGGSAASSIGGVNNQSGVTSYITMAGDYGALVVLSDASAIAVTLTTQSPPWFCWIANQGTGTATLTPFSGTINGAASFDLAPDYTTVVAFDGTNWWAGGVQLSIADIAGLAAALALLAPLASPVFTGIPEAPTASPLTDDTQIATTAYADAAVLVETTRAETAEALLAPIASPTFTGTVTQPDATVLTAPTTATSATAGAASALPATPAGYLEMSLGGTTFKVPYYAV